GPGADAGPRAGGGEQNTGRRRGRPDPREHPPARRAGRQGRAVGERAAHRATPRRHRRRHRRAARRPRRRLRRDGGRRGTRVTAASIGFVFAPTYGWLVAARVLQGLGALGVWVGAITLAADLSESQSMGRSLSWLTGTWSLGFIAGPALGGLGSLQAPFVLY